MELSKWKCMTISVISETEPAFKSSNWPVEKGARVWSSLSSSFFSFYTIMSVSFNMNKQVPPSPWRLAFHSALQCGRPKPSQSRVQSTGLPFVRFGTTPAECKSYCIMSAAMWNSLTFSEIHIVFWQELDKKIDTTCLSGKYSLA